MLTQNDLQAIGRIFDKRFDLLENKLGSVETKLTKKIDSVEAKLTEGTDSPEIKLTKKINSLAKKTNYGFKSADKKLDLIINYFDHQDKNINRRLDRIETHLGLAPLNS